MNDITISNTLFTILVLYLNMLPTLKMDFYLLYGIIYVLLEISSTVRTTVWLCSVFICILFAFHFWTRKQDLSQCACADTVFGCTQLFTKIKAQSVHRCGVSLPETQWSEPVMKATGLRDVFRCITLCKQAENTDYSASFGPYWELPGVKVPEVCDVNPSTVLLWTSGMQRLQPRCLSVFLHDCENQTDSATCVLCFSNCSYGR